MAQTEAEKTAALQAALQSLERQAQKTNKSLQTVLELPEAKKLADQVDQITKAIEKQLAVRENLEAQVDASAAALKRLEAQQESLPGLRPGHRGDRGEDCRGKSSGS